MKVKIESSGRQWSLEKLIKLSSNPSSGTLNMPFQRVMQYMQRSGLVLSKIKLFPKTSSKETKGNPFHTSKKGCLEIIIRRKNKIRTYMGKPKVPDYKIKSHSP